MSRSKKTLIIIGVIIFFILGLSFFISKEYRSTTTTEIDAPANFVYNAINDLQYQSAWNGKESLDTTFQLNCTGKTKGAGSSCDYKSESYGAGVLRIIYSHQDSIVLTDEPDGQKLRTFYYKMTPIDDAHTSLTVTGIGTSGFFTNLWNVIHRWKLSKHIKHGLDNFKIFMLDRYRNKIYHGYKVNEVPMNQKFFLAQRSEVAFENVQQYYTQNISGLYQLAIQNKLVVAGMPCGLFYRWDEINQKTDMAAALPLLAELNIAESDAINIPAQTALKIEYKGESNKSAEAHYAMDAYILDHQLRHDLPIIEEYMTDPAKEPDPTKWVTNIYYYVSPK
ncbi:MAG: GyrI-like domain-containing protein [Saprospiraceae bacterium]|nr:GyrI-like domain-containing protein [Saprospiraceae bacterium]